MLSNSDYLYLYRIAASILPEGKVPKWLLKHKALQKLPKKVFPSFGLKNFKEKIQINDVDDIVDLKLIYNILEDIITHLSTMRGIITIKTNEYLLYGPKENIEGDAGRIISKLKYDKEELLKSATRSFMDTQNDLFHSYKVSPDGKIKLIIHSDIVENNKIICGGGEGLFKAYGKIKDNIDSFLQKLNASERMTNIDSFPSVKEFNAQNVSLLKKDYYIVFSSTGEEGAWDIATMSMRGIDSCQSWNLDSDAPGIHSACLIGSIASKFVGVIYLTSDTKTQYGSKMVKRCVVRFGFDTSTDPDKITPVILLDKMYDKYNEFIGDKFVEALQRRTNIKVINLNKGWSQNLNLPEEELPDIKKDLRYIELSQGKGKPSYQDFKIETYKRKERNKLPGPDSNDYFYYHYIDAIDNVMFSSKFDIRDKYTNPADDRVITIAYREIAKKLHEIGMSALERDRARAYDLNPILLAKMFFRKLLNIDFGPYVLNAAEEYKNLPLSRYDADDREISDFTQKAIIKDINSDIKSRLKQLYIETEEQ